MMVEIYRNIAYFMKLTSNPELLWTIFPLILATIIMLIYFEKYNGEKPGWNTYVANSLVLLFVSVILFRYIYNINGLGAINFITYPYKLIVSSGLFLIGAVLLFLNFEHFLPEKIAMYVSSPLTLNLVAYISILFVYSGLRESLALFISLIIIFILFSAALNILKIPIKKLFMHIKKMKEKERIENIIEEKRKIEEEKRRLKKEERRIKMAELRKLEKEKKEAIKLKKLVREKL